MSGEIKEIGELSLKHEGVTAEWTIKDVLSYTEEEESFYSSTFSVPGSQWRLKVFPNGYDQDSVGWIALFLHRVEDWTYPKRADYSIAAIDMNGEVLAEMKNETDVFANLENGYGLSKFLQRSRLSPSKSLIVSCTLRVSDCLDATSALMKLTEDLKDMFICKRCSDATLKVKNRELSVHKAVLESRSRVFESMFEVDMKEKKTGVVEIVGCDPDVFRDFLIYLYSGKFENSTKKDFDLYRIADKYAVEELKSECVRSMLSNLCMDNLFDVVCLGHEFGEKELELKSQEFFDEKFSEIVPNDKWDSFLDEHSQLAKKLLKNMAMNMREQKPL